MLGVDVNDLENLSDSTFFFFFFFDTLIDEGRRI